ncbi:uncharacterized protein LOC119386445 isoform X2 [Rhipicephalus sanguineus]|uniref:uncharacterized protein LOC119386445 isoform X2 n=1 Tax=Rhipicephalus sanguineus TaxID=34632 RepID=UPI0020C4D5A1|nr:uncharacterized protein LOC119386445 isoform X2 [Rhipicephalus sanguineus]
MCKKRLQMMMRNRMQKEKGLKKRDKRTTKQMQKKNLYEKILKKNLEDAHKKAQSGQKPRAQPSKGTSSSSYSESSDSDELCAKTELLQMKKKKEVWKARTKVLAQKELEKDRDLWKLRSEELQQENRFLKQQVASLQRCLESKIFELAVKQDRAPCSRGTLPALSDVAEETESLVRNPLDMNNKACSERVSCK